MTRYFVRLGSLGEVIIATAMMRIDRGRRVVLRSPRGIEIAEVLAPCNQTVAADSTYRVLRPTTDSDERLANRLLRHKREAMEACQTRLRESGSDAVLLDVDQFLDGATLKLHFLGDVDSAAHSIADDVAKRYETIVQSDHLAELLNEGCGPDCGSAAKSACGSCVGCVGCGSHR
ncbi:MAG: hypothetical protein AAFU85_18960 [Planctomycetota bacterium]